VDIGLILEPPHRAPHAVAREGADELVGILAHPEEVHHSLTPLHSIVKVSPKVR
jgi:hypothetical protein